jgi:amino acid transporter
VQGVIVSLLALAIVLLPSVQSAYQILGQMATIIILAMYVIMYVAGIRLRYTQPNKKRPFRIPGGNFGMWCVGGIGLIGALAAGFLSFVPPQQIKTGSPAIYIGILLVGTAIALAIPFIIYAFHKPEWKAADNQFAPFDWQVEGRKPSQVSTASAPAGPVAQAAATPTPKAAA